MKGIESESGAIPESVMDAVNHTLSNVEEVHSHLHEFMSLSDPEVLAEMPPLQRAQSLFLLAKITSTLFALKLKCSGVHPDDHPVKTELDRLRLYQDKLERLEDLSKAPLQPSTTLNYRAATRFIEHSLPDLTSEQRQNMRNISRGEGTKMNYQERSGQKRKYQSSEKQSVQTATKEFLEKAARELLVWLKKMKLWQSSLCKSQEEISQWPCCFRIFLSFLGNAGFQWRFLPLLNDKRWHILTCLHVNYPKCNTRDCRRHALFKSFYSCRISYHLSYV